MTRVVWLTASTLVVGRAIADIVDPCVELDPTRVAAVIFLGLLFAGAIAAFIRRGDL